MTEVKKSVAAKISGKAVLRELAREFNARAKTQHWKKAAYNKAAIEYFIGAFVGMRAVLVEPKMSEMALVLLSVRGKELIDQWAAFTDEEVAA